MIEASPEWPTRVMARGPRWGIVAWPRIRQRTLRLSLSGHIMAGAAPGGRVRMSDAICQKCGTAMQGGTYCPRCGSLFGRQRPLDRRPAGGPGDRAAAGAGPTNAPAGSLLRRVYRVGRLVVAAALGTALVLILWTASPPRVAADAQAPQRLERKMERFQAETRLGLSPRLRLDESEVNSWMRSNLDLADRRASKAKATSGGAPPGADLAAPTGLSAEEVQSNVRDIQVHMQGDRMTAYVLFDLYGKDLSLTLEGRLSVEGGYLRLSPTRMMLGSLPIPQATVERAVGSLFDSPQNRERFRLPPNVRDLRVENGQLVVALR